MEGALFGGTLMGVAATNALELGIDVGSLDITLHLGFPGAPPQPCRALLKTFVLWRGAALPAYCVLCRIDRCLRELIGTLPHA